MATYRIHPGLGIAHLGNSPDAFCISPEGPAALPIDCDGEGNPLLTPDGESEQTISTFKDAEGRIKRQAARFQVWVFDDESPEGRPLKLGDRIEGGGNAGTLVDIRWRVWLANKKAAWYQFKQLDGEHGYGDNHPLRNAQVQGDAARQRLIIDPGPRVVDCTQTRRARFDRDSAGEYPTTFPPPLKPNSIDTLGDLLTDGQGRLLVLGGHGNSGSYLFDDFGQPRIDNYANNDGWFDDISDGPVMARLVMYAQNVGGLRFIDVESPAWALVGYPSFVPEILDIITLPDVIENMAVTQFAERTDLYGTDGTWNCPEKIPPTDQGALIHWRAGRLAWNPDYRPWFYRDIWPILFRPDQYSYLCDILQQSNYPHNYSTRGTFDPYKLGVPPQVNWDGVHKCEARCIRRHHNGELFVETLMPTLQVLEKPAEEAVQAKAQAMYAPTDVLTGSFLDDIQAAVAKFSNRVLGPHKEDVGFEAYLDRFRRADEKPSYPKAKDDLENEILGVVRRVCSRTGPRICAQVERLTLDHLRKFHNTTLLNECRRRCVEGNTSDPFGPMRTYLFGLLRKPGEENEFSERGRASSRRHNLPLMPLLCGDNPISNTLPSKFLRLTDFQYYLLWQWARGLFYNEDLGGWTKAAPDPWWPYGHWKIENARDLDRGVLFKVLGGSFCPGGEVSWVIRNPAIWVVPYRIKADPTFYVFGQTAAQANQFGRAYAEPQYTTYMQDSLSLSSDFTRGLQPGDLTKYSSVPWQSDYNECSTQYIDITYELFNQIAPKSEKDELMLRERRVWQTLWWPAHRPMQTYELVSVSNGPSIQWRDWTPGITQTPPGDLAMVTEWWRLPFVRRNPFMKPWSEVPTSNPPPQPVPYISVERTKR